MPTRACTAAPIDGWFAIYNRSILPLLLELPFEPYFSLGAMVLGRLAQQGQHGVLDLGMKVFHVIGPEYAHAFGMLDFEIAKYRRLGRAEIVDWYENHRRAAGSREELDARIEAIRLSLDSTMSPTI